MRIVGSAHEAHRQITNLFGYLRAPQKKGVARYATLSARVCIMDKTTIDTYNKLALDYDQETITFWDEFPQTFITKFAESINGTKVLDIGSGPGRDGLILKKLGLDITCLDASEAMITLCKNRGLKAILGDFNQLPFEDNSFDAIWAYTSLLHVPRSSISRSLSEIKRVLREDGRLGIGMIEGETEGYRESAGVNKPRWFTYYTQDELKQLLIDNGFDITFFEAHQPGRSSQYLHYICHK